MSHTSPHTHPSKRVRFGALVAFLVVVAAFSTVLAAAAPAATVKVWFVQGEQMIAVPRSAVTAQEAIAQLLAGPTRAEAQRGIGTYVPSGTTLRSVTVESGIATIDLSLKFALGRDGASLLPS